MRTMLLAACVAGAVARCPSELTPGNHLRSLTVGGQERRYYAYVPHGNEGHPRAMLTMWHGCGSSPEKFEMESAMDAAAERHGVINVYPEGTYSSATRQGWNAGFSTCGDGRANDVDFAKAVVLDMIEHACVDVSKIYASGFSNGGSMTSNLTCEMSDVFRAYSITGSSMPNAVFPAHCSLPNVAKPVVNVCGGTDGCSRSVASWFNEYAGASRCTDAAVTTEVSATTTCHKHSSCGAAGDEPLEYCLIAGLGHCWSGNDCCDTQCLNQNPANLDSSDYILKFFGSLPAARSVLSADQMQARLRASLSR